jgi:hypothetical protein
VTRLGFSYPNHKSFGIRRQVFRSEINFWGEKTTLLWAASPDVPKNQQQKEEESCGMILK